MTTIKTRVSCAASLLLSLLLMGGCSRPPAAPVSPQPIPIETSTLRFVNVATTAGLKYRWQTPSHSPLNILETIGNGCAFLDYDADGNLDILLIGSPLALFHGDGKGHFEDVTQATRLDRLKGHFLGCAVGDTDNDGFEDLYLSGYGAGLLLHNEAGKTFSDATRTANILPQGWGTSAAFGDIDGDGRLDLYVGNYVQFDAKAPQFCPTNGVLTSCPPETYKGVAGRLYRNLGGERFADASQAWGVSRSQGKTLGVAFADLDASGRQSLVLANDMTPGELFYNRGNSFESIGAASGVAYSSVGSPQAGMGQDWGDFDNDGRLDLTVMTFSTELKPIYRNEGSRFFTDVSSAMGTANAVIPYVAFGVKWLDADNDGWLDLLISNGHTADNIADTGQNTTFRQPTLLLHNRAGKRFTLAPQPDLDRPIVGRGLATGDYDNDGKVDALVVDSAGEPVLLHNETPQSGHWLTLKLRGKKGNRNGYGASVLVEVGGKKRLRHCHADGSYLSSSDARVHFGLGDAKMVDKITIRWSGGAVQTLKDVATDRVLRVEEGGNSQ